MTGSVQRGKAIAASRKYAPKAKVRPNGNDIDAGNNLADLHTGDGDSIPLPPEPPDVDHHHVGEWAPNDGQKTTEDIETQPIPLAPSVSVPHFPVEALPDPIAEMVRAVAEATQTDPAMAGTSALSALSACTGGHAEIEIRPGWREPLNIYTATIAAPGERKSAVQRQMVRPLLDVERELAQKGAAARLEAQTRKDVATNAADRERRAAAAVEPDKQDKALADAIGAAAFAESITVPPIPRLVADDVTPEAAASLLAEQCGRLAVISAEGGIFDIIAGRYSLKVNMDLWLKGHSGDMLRVDRKGRPPEYIRRPALTLGLMIQPAVLQTIAANRDFRGRGLLARFLYAMPEARAGRRKIAPPPVGPDTEKDYETTVANLAAGMAEWAGDPAVLMLTPAAQKAMVQIEEAVEPTLADDAELAPLKDWGAKYVGAIARIAGIIHLAEHGPELGPRRAIEAETIEQAAQIGDYFKMAAIRVFSEMGTDKVTFDAIYLLGRIEQLGRDELSERDLFTAASRSRFKTRQDLRPVLDRLTDHGYLVPLPTQKPTGGRPASPRYRVIAIAAQAAEGER